MRNCACDIREREEGGRRPKRTARHEMKRRSKREALLGMPAGDQGLLVSQSVASPSRPLNHSRGRKTDELSFPTSTFSS